MNKLTKQRREVKSPFTNEERQGVFVTIEESRERRDKLTKQPSPPDNQMGGYSWN